MREVEVVVVGGGVMGAAAARSLAARGREVVLLERFEIGHRRGASHGDARVFRLSYDAPDWVRMMQEALRLWRELEEEAGEPLLTTTGMLDLDPPPAHADALDACGVPYEVLPAAEAMARHPSVAIPPDTEVLLQADAGFISAERAWRAFSRLAEARGAEVRERTTAAALRVSGEAVEVRAGEEVLRARTAVVSAGAWSPGLLEPLGIALPVRVTRETPVFFGLEGPAPPVVVEWRTPPIYALPSPDYGLKAAQHGAGPEVEPDAAAPPDEEAVERARSWVVERFPDAEAIPRHAETCLYTSTSDERFILERRGPVVVGSACSGHAFKFAPLVGERLAELVARRV